MRLHLLGAGVVARASGVGAGGANPSTVEDADFWIMHTEATSSICGWMCARFLAIPHHAVCRRIHTSILRY